MNIDYHTLICGYSKLKDVFSLGLVCKDYNESIFNKTQQYILYEQYNQLIPYISYTNDNIISEYDSTNKTNYYNKLKHLIITHCLNIYNYCRGWKERINQSHIWGYIAISEDNTIMPFSQFIKKRRNRVSKKIYNRLRSNDYLNKVIIPYTSKPIIWKPFETIIIAISMISNINVLKSTINTNDICNYFVKSTKLFCKKYRSGQNKYCNRHKDMHKIKHCTRYIYNEV